MTTYEHICTEKDCQHEWEDVYGMTEPIPTHCPKCGKASVKRLISGGSGKGKVELTGRELKEKLMADGQQLKRDAMKDEKLRANLIGDDKYQSNTKRFEKDVSEYRKIQNERPRIRKSR